MPNRKKQERREFKIKLNEILKRIQRKRLKFEERKSLFAVHPHPLIMNPKLIFQDVSKKNCWKYFLSLPLCYYSIIGSIMEKERSEWEEDKRLFVLFIMMQRQRAPLYTFLVCVCVSVYVCMCLYVCLPVCVSVCLRVYLCLSLCTFFVYVYVRVCVCT